MKEKTDSSQKQHILVLEDDYFIQLLVTRSLKDAGFEVTTASSTDEALQNIGEIGLPHLAVVDILLGEGLNGLEFCEIVHTFCDLPIIMLSAVTNFETIIQAIEFHVEDYVRKPFEVGELVARVRRVLKRIGNFAYTLDPITTIDERLQVEFHKQLAYVENQRIQLTPAETKLLYILMRNAGKTLTTNFILRRMWPMEKAYEDRLRVCVYRLRRKLDTAPHDYQYIQSTRGVGYRFMSPYQLILSS